jgi:hypothetical protein
MRFESNSNVFKYFQMISKYRSNIGQSKKDAPELGKFEIKYGFEGFDETNNFPYINFFRCEVDFE